MFITHEQSLDRERARKERLAELAAAVASYDADPLLPGERFYGGNVFEGCYSGLLLAKDDTHVAIWGKASGRVAILPVKDTSKMRVGTAYAVTAWHNRLQSVRPLTASYGWLDAMDDFIVALQRTIRYDEALMAGLRTEDLVLDQYGRVKGSYRDIHRSAQARRGSPEELVWESPEFQAAERERMLREIAESGETKCLICGAINTGKPHFIVCPVVFAE